MPVVANDQDLQKLLLGLEEIERFGIRDLAANIGEEAVELVHQGFDEARDPYGKPWAALTSRDGEPLRKTNRMENSLHVARATAQEVVIAMGAWYSIVHQEGRTIRPLNRSGPYRPGGSPALAFEIRGQLVFAKEVTIPARPFFPRENDLPSAWKSSFDEVAQEWLDGKLGV